ncbi:MAG: hypothetical protein ACM30E_08685, partial [Nitrososphaerales archaeon]
YRYPDLVAAGYDNEGANLTTRGQMRDAPFSLKDSVNFSNKDPYGWAIVPSPKNVQYPGRPAVSMFNDSYGYYPGAEFVPGGPVGQTAPRWMTKNWDASGVTPATKAYAPKAAGYNGTDRFRWGCSLNAAGQVLCYSYASGIGVEGGTGNPGDTMAQYGWHVQVLSQSDSVATVKVWNSMKEVQGVVTQTPSSLPIVNGSTVKVDVKVTNIGSPINGLFIAPIDAEEGYVADSVYGGAFPITAAMAQEMAAKAGIAKIDGLPEAADAGAVVAVALTATPATGETVNFGFSTMVTADSGLLRHTVTVFDSSTLLETLESNSLMIGAATQLYLPVIAR